jgi:hypothetical protein
VADVVLATAAAKRIRSRVMSRRSLLAAVASSCVAALACSETAAPPPSARDPGQRLAAYVSGLRDLVDPRAASALERVDGIGRQLLAARSYLRAGTGIGDRWSWTAEQISAFEGSADQQGLLEQIDAVRSAFEQANPGYTLFVNERVRSLDEQLSNWNGNDSVAAAAANLESAAQAFLAKSGWPAPGEQIVRGLAAFLQSQTPEPRPTLAAPGLSAHGQMHAVDFHVYKGDLEVAVPEAATIESIWEAQGWGERLAAAVRQSGAKFTGPLAAPREPWHYQYTP